MRNFYDAKYVPIIYTARSGRRPFSRSNDCPSLDYMVWNTKLTELRKSAITDVHMGRFAWLIILPLEEILNARVNIDYHSRCIQM